MNTRAWVLRPIVWFVAASAATTMIHEVAHAAVAFALGVRSTLFNYSADVDLTPAQAATGLPALIAAAGPVSSFAAGMFSWLAFRRARGSAAGLPLLYLSVFGIATFFGNLMSASLVGDFSAVAVAFGLPMTVRFAIAVAGGLSVAAIHVWAGHQLVRWVPSHVGTIAGTLGVIALPVMVGTAAVILINSPMPMASVTARGVEASFWLFAAAGALVTGRRVQTSQGDLGLRWADGAAILLAVLMVRLMARGIALAP